MRRSSLIENAVPVFTCGQTCCLTSGNLPTMKRYYFDLRDGDALAPDEEASTFPESRRPKWSRGFPCGHGQDAVLGSAKHGEVHNMAIEVRDGNGPVLTAKLTFEKIQPIS